MPSAILRIFLTIALACCLVSCIAESRFRLSEESRLPIWFELPEGKKRSDVTVRLYYYVKPSGREAKLVFEDRDSWFDIDSVKGKQKGLMPLYLKTSTGELDKGAAYEVLSVDGKTDIIGHKGMNDIFFMVDDPAVWLELGIERKE